MSLKLLLLKNGDQLVSEVKSVKDEDGKKDIHTFSPIQ